MTSLKKINKNGGLKELRERLFFVLSGIIIFRLGVYIPVPCIDSDQLSRLISLQHTSSNGLLSMFNMFSGGALERLSIFALGVMPYISASIIIQIMSTVSTKLIEWKKEGAAGQKKISQYTKYASLVLALLQSLGVAVYTTNQSGLISADSKLLFYCSTVISMTSGSMFLIWLGEQMTERGVGNGISILIFSSIVANLPFEISTTVSQAHQGLISYMTVFILLLTLVAIVAFVVFIERAQRRIKVNYAKRQKGRRIMSTMQASHLPLKLNMAGVVPPIFASSILMIPGMLANWFASIPSLEWMAEVCDILQPGSLLYTLIFSIAIIFFCFFYTALIFNPRDTADNLRRSGAFITGVRPGEQTAKYIDLVMSRLTLIGSIYITAICLLPIFFMNCFGGSLPFTFGGTSLLIVVVVIMDFISQIQSYIMSNQYDSLMKKANLTTNFDSKF